MALYGSRIGLRLVEAHQLPPEGEEGSDQLASFLQGHDVDNDGAGGLVIHRPDHEPTQHAHPRDYVVRLPDGRLWALPPAVFAALFIEA